MTSERNGVDGRAEPRSTEVLRARVAAQFPALRGDLERLVRVPSVSSPAFDQEHVEHSARLVAELLREVGLRDVRVLRAPAPTAGGPAGAPAVVGHRPGPPGAPTVLLYAHHDVQPPGDRADWDTDPFVPTELDGRLYGRGAADDKAGIVVHVGALRALGEELPVGVTVFVEGEEEIGSPTFSAFLEAHRADLAADVIVVADSFNWAVGVPALTTSLRGLVDVVVEVRVLEHAVHSGTYGGVVLDALTVLARLVATLHDADGSVAVPGLVHAEDPAVDYDERMLRAEAGVVEGVELSGTGPLSARLWTRPAIAVIGLDAPSVDQASNTIVPVARAKISLRVAPGQNPSAAMVALREHLLAQAPSGARVTVLPGATGEAFAAPEDSPAMRAARWAFEESWGTPPVDIGVGGSIPFIAELLEAYPRAQILVTGVEDPDSRAHGTNESVHLGELERAVLAHALLLHRLGVAGD